MAAQKAPIRKREPVVVIVTSVGGAITGVIGAGVLLLNSFHPGAVTDPQRDALVAFVAALWLLLGLVGAFIRQVVYSPASVDDIRDGGGQ
jgi:LPS O-antigen subunit length determinant protein (WzzB/FepE family)